MPLTKPKKPPPTPGKPYCWACGKVLDSEKDAHGHEKRFCNGTCSMNYHTLGEVF